jgi:hypothetical protein
MDVKEYYMFGCCTFIYANKSWVRKSTVLRSVGKDPSIMCFPNDSIQSVFHFNRIWKYLQYFLVFKVSTTWEILYISKTVGLIDLAFFFNSVTN